MHIGIAPEITKAMALLWAFHTRAAIHRLIQALEWRHADGREITLDDVKASVRRLEEDGQAVESPERKGLIRLTEPVRAAAYADLLERNDTARLRNAVFGLNDFHLQEALDRWPVSDPGATAAIFRLAMFSGLPAEVLRQMAESIGKAMDREAVLAEAAFAGFDGTLFGRVDPPWRWEVASRAAATLCDEWNPALLSLTGWAIERLEAGEGDLPDDLRLALARALLLQGEAARAQAALAPLDCASADALRACLLIQAGRFDEGRAAFEGASKRRQAEISARKHLFPCGIAWFHPLALLALRTPAELEAARKLCVAEAGPEGSETHEAWAPWIHAIGARLGANPLDRDVLLPRAPLLADARQAGLADLWRLLLAAWIGPDEMGFDRDDTPARQMDEAASALRRRLRACRFHWLEAQLDAALAVLRGEEPDAPFFAAGRKEAWQGILDSLRALAGELAESEEETRRTRLVWAIRIAPDGALEGVEVLEQKRGRRGWGQPKPVSLAALAEDEELPAHDARVMRAVRRDRQGHVVLDRALAIQALVGHPAVVLAEAPERPVELIEAQPEIEVTREERGLVIRLRPALRPEGEAGEPAEAEPPPDRDALKAVTLVRETPQRLRLVRLSQAQQRIARLIGEGVAVPAEASDALQETLRALAGHFQVQGEHARAARQVAPESRLRAELGPVGEHLMLRLVAAPLGPNGPRLPPGHGRPRLMAAVEGETVGTRRDLRAERANLESVLDALDFLEEPEDGAAGYEWVVEDPEHALEMVECLPRLPAIVSVDWPKGQHLKVVTLDGRQLALEIRSRRDWFGIDGEARPAKGVRLPLDRLVEVARGESRFIPMGEGTFVALTRALKQRLGELAALAEKGRQGLQVPRAACGWLAEVLEGMEAHTDEGFHAAAEQMGAAQEQQAAIEVPPDLHTQLRPYQEEGFRWAMGLAQAGFGACLADDMGLGKTLQALAVLLARAGGGPALVLAPTSVIGNWREEAERFAPGLDVRDYGEADRDEVLDAPDPGQVVIASYALFQMDEERFTAIHWHTVVADEAQAIKNPDAKRTAAAFELEADFRLALSGTPIENRLTELWSIMNFINPGLLGSQTRFEASFATPIERDNDRHARQLLRRLTAPFILRRTKAQVLHELPPRTERQLVIAPPPDEAAHYEDLRREAREEARRALAEDAEKARFGILAQLMRLRRAACDPRLATPGFSGEGAKVQAFAELAEELRANGHKALVFSQFVDFLALLRAPLDAAGIPYQYLDGSTPAAERSRRVAAFQAGEGDLFLISLKAGGQGLNLTAADYVIITDPWWNPAAEDQAMGRAHRMGQRRPVTAYRLITRGTVEERIVELHQEKRALAEDILSEGEAARLPSADELAGLIRATME